MRIHATSLRVLGVLIAAVLTMTCLQLTEQARAVQPLCGGSYGSGSCGGGGGTSGGGSNSDASDGTVRAQYSSGNGAGAQTCSVYANGTGMGSYCVSGGVGTLKTLRERFQGLSYQQCRYREIPEGVPVPFNANPDEGRYMLQVCLQNINWNTFSGGTNKVIKVDVVFVPNGTDTSDDENALNTFLWNAVEQTQQLPVPFLHPRPNITPVVGVPTFFTFRWLDPASRTVVRDPAGPYANREVGGPFKRITTPGGMIMEAEATEIRIDMRQRDMQPFTCRPDTPYREGVRASQQPDGACRITFSRSAASAAEYATVPIPSQYRDVYFPRIEVEWRVRYGNPGNMQELGDGFTMRIFQQVPVQEIQAPNQPPTVIY